MQNGREHDGPSTGRLRRAGWRRVALWTGLGAVALFGLIQLVPYGRDHTNPPVTAEPSWDSPQTRAQFMVSCGDCHSNLTKWPLYSDIAPVSWLVQNDVNGGRSTLNVSEWNRPQDAASDVVEAILGGDMPPSYYTVIHRSASMSDAQKQALARGWRATLQRSPAIPGGGG